MQHLNSIVTSTFIFLLIIIVKVTNINTTCVIVVVCMGKTYHGQISGL